MYLHIVFSRKKNTHTHYITYIPPGIDFSKWQAVEVKFLFVSYDYPVSLAQFMKKTLCIAHAHVCVCTLVYFCTRMCVCVLLHTFRCCIYIYCTLIRIKCSKGYQANRKGPSSVEISSQGKSG